MADRPNPGDLWGGMSTGVAISSTLLAGVLVYAGLGMLIDRLAGTEKVFTAIGMILGAVLGIYIIYVRYGKVDGTKP
jgi:F0F1-type ATP synthase assembly protein I